MAILVVVVVVLSRYRAFLSHFLLYSTVTVFRYPGYDTVRCALVWSTVGMRVWVLLYAVLLTAVVLRSGLRCCCGLEKTGFPYHFLALLQRGRIKTGYCIISVIPGVKVGSVPEQ